MANRLASATSPYLLQHADNPVDWWPWSRRGVRRGAPAGRAGADLRRLRGLPLVSRDGARVVRGRGGRRAGQRGLRGDQGGPRGAARRRRRLHDRHPGDDRAGRLADDGLRHPRRRAVLLRHLLPEGQLRPAARLGHHRLARPARRRCSQQGAAVVQAIGGAQLVGGPTAPISAELLDAAAASARQGARPDGTADSAAPRSSRRT